MKIRFLLLGWVVLSQPLWVQAASENRPLVIAHRGASGYLPEHTLPAKALAYGMGADVIEQDVVLSKDGVPVVLHDIHVDTTTDVVMRFPDRHRADGRYYALDFTVAELKQLRVTERISIKTGKAVFPQRFPPKRSSFQISTLAEELELIAGLNQSTGRQVGIYPEIKQPFWHRQQGHDLSQAVLAVLERFHYRSTDDPCWLQCFEYPEIKRLREELAWKGRLILLVGTAKTGENGTDYEELTSDAGLQRLSREVDGIGPPLSRVMTWSQSSPGKPVLSNLVQRAHVCGLRVHPYTVRKDELPSGCPSLDALHAALFSEAKVDGVFTDFPDLTGNWLRHEK